MPNPDTTSNPNTMPNSNESVVISFRVSAQKIQEFEIELQQNKLNKGKFLTDLFDQRHVLTYLKETEGLLIEGISGQNMGYLNAYCSLKSINLNDLMLVLIQDFINQQSTDKMYTDTSVLENTANDTQLSGIQAFANANELANGSANGRIRHNSQKTVNSANRQKALENIGKMLVKEMLSNQLFANAEKVIDYAVNNSGMMSRQLDQQLLYQILFEHFSEDQLENLTYHVDDARTD